MRSAKFIATTGISGLKSIINDIKINPLIYKCNVIDQIKYPDTTNIDKKYEIEIDINIKNNIIKQKN